MKLLFHTRPSDSHYVQQIDRVRAETASSFSAIPDGSWGLVIWRAGSERRVYVTGSTTRSVLVSMNAGDEILSISFKPGVYSPCLSAEALLDKARLVAAADARSIWWNKKERLEVPTFENADQFVATLMEREQLTIDRGVAAMLAGHSPPMSLRTLQRRFVKTTGLTHNYWQQIRRAQTAIHALHCDKSLAQVAFEAGYVDQSHMTRWLKQIVGRTPGEIARDNSP